MVTTTRARRKRTKRRVETRPQTDDEVDDANFVNHLWPPLTVINLILLAISLVLGLVGSSIEDLFLVLYALSCLFLFAATTSYVIQEADKDIKDAPLNRHIDRKRTLKQVVRGAATMVFFIWVLYLPGLFIPAVVFRKEWLTYLALLIVIALLLYGGLSVLHWWWDRTVKPE